MAEALAIQSSFLMAALFGFTKLSINSNSKTLITAINHKQSIKEKYDVLTDIKQISSLFVYLSFSFIHRLHNEEADALAKTELRFSYCNLDHVLG